MRSVARDTRQRRAAARKVIPQFLDCTEIYRGCGFGTPTGVANFTTQIAPGSGDSGHGNLTVSGAQGDSVVTYSAVNEGAAADYAGTYGCVILHDDGTYGFYTASSLNTGASTLAICPTLQAAVTNKQLSNVQHQAGDVHLTELAHKAIGKFIQSSTKRYGYRDRYIHRMMWDIGGRITGVLMTVTGGLTTGGTLAGTSIAKGIQGSSVNAYDVYPNCTAYSGADRSGGFYGDPFCIHINGELAGQGATQTVALNGASGHVEFGVCVSGQFTTNEASKARVVVVIDGVTVVNKLCAAYERIKAPFNTAQSLTVTITLETSVATSIRVSRLMVLAWNRRLEIIDEALIPSGSNVVMCMDSWGLRAGRAIANTIVALDPTIAITNVSVGGQVASWAISNFKNLVASFRPGYAIFDFIINDLNAMSSGPGADDWVRNVRSLIRLCAEAGITPIFLCCPVTTSNTTSQEYLKFYQTLMSYYSQTL